MLLIDYSIAGESSKEWYKSVDEADRERLRSKNYEEKLWQIQNGCCFYCSNAMRRQTPFEMRQTPKTATRDHFLPKSKGFKSTRGNMVWACGRCNVSKASKPPTFRDIVRLILLYEQAELPCVFKFVTKGGRDITSFLEL